MRRRPWSAGLVVMALAACGNHGDRVLVFSRTNGYRHADSIDAAAAALPALVPEVTFELTEDPLAFHDLEGYRAVVFLYTSGNDVLDDTGKTAFESFVRDGGGWLGVHSATDTEYLWPFYQRVTVAHFVDHPAIQPATVMIEQPHAAVRDVPLGPWLASDEWYNFDANPRLTGGVTVLATIDETTYSGGTMGVDHPLIWCHENVGGRSFYTALGHIAERWTEPAFTQHIGSGLRWVLGR